MHIIGVGPAEGVVVLIITLLSLVIPIAVLIWFVVSIQGIKTSLKRIEQILEQKNESQR